MNINPYIVLNRGAREALFIKLIMSKIDIFFPLQYSSHGLVQLETFLEKKYF